MIVFSDVILIVVASALTVLAVLAIVWLTAPKSKGAISAAQLACGEIFLRFDDGVCVEASPSALDVLNKNAPADVEFLRARETLSNRFDALNILLEAQSANGWPDLDESVPSSVSSDVATLHIKSNQTGCTFRVSDPAVPSAADRHKAMTGKARSKFMFETLNKVPIPIWSNNENGDLIWSNRAFKALAQASKNQGSVLDFDISRATRPNGDRVSVTNPLNEDEIHWFDISMVELDQDRYLSYATNIDGIMAAETAQRKFVQTLAKTFAQLSIGLAIFDRDRKLVLFNPALVDLTTLPAQFLSVRPNLQSFFDKLRESRIMPEPKDYASWRKQIADLVVKAAGGDYQETWGLPSGLTYRISGRPHPDGAIAILIEDITAEITLTRRFKGQIELGNRALETLSDAIIVFGPDGNAVFWNSAFRQFYQLPIDAQVADHDLHQILKISARRFAAGPELDKLKHALRNPRDAGVVKGRIPQKKGPPLSFELRTHDGTATIVTLRTSELAARQAFPELTPAG